MLDQYEKCYYKTKPRPEWSLYTARSINDRCPTVIGNVSVFAAIGRAQ